MGLIWWTLEGNGGHGYCCVIVEVMKGVFMIFHQSCNAQRRFEQSDGSLKIRLDFSPKQQQKNLTALIFPRWSHLCRCSTFSLYSVIILHLPLSSISWDRATHHSLSFSVVSKSTYPGRMCAHLETIKWGRNRTGFEVIMIAGHLTDTRTQNLNYFSIGCLLYLRVISWHRKHDVSMWVISLWAFKMCVPNANYARRAGNWPIYQRI